MVVGDSIPSYSGALSIGTGNARWSTTSGSRTMMNKLLLNANNSNAIYTDNGLILPKSISKQSYIIYK